MPRRIVSSLFSEDAIMACFIRVHAREIAEAFGVPPGCVPIVDDSSSPELDIEPAPRHVPAPRLLRRKRRGGGRPS